MTDFPLLTLHPVSDARHRWVALLIEAPLPADAATLSAASVHWLGELGLRKALGSLPCVLPAMPIAGLALDPALLDGDGPCVVVPPSASSSSFKPITRGTRRSQRRSP